MLDTTLKTTAWREELWNLFIDLKYNIEMDGSLLEVLNSQKVSSTLLILSVLFDEIKGAIS